MSAAPLPADDWTASVHERLVALLDAPPGDAPPVAVFDWDDTVIAGDLSLAMLRTSDAENGTDWHDAYFALLEAHGREVAYPQITRWYAGRTPAAFRAFTEQVVAQSLERGIVAYRPPMVALVAAMLARGWQVWVVTASPGLLVAPMAAQLGIPGDRVLGMTLEVDHTGVMTDRVAGIPTFGDGKARTVDAWIGRAPTFVAGDSSSDLPMMRLAHRVLLVDGHDASLRAEARAHGWMIQSGWHHTPAEPGIPTAPEAS